jgi:hypothetical protein
MQRAGGADPRRIGDPADRPRPPWSGAGGIPLANGFDKLALGGLADRFGPENMMAFSYIPSGLLLFVTVFAGLVHSDVPFVAAAIAATFFWASLFSLFPITGGQLLRPRIGGRDVRPPVRNRQGHRRPLRRPPLHAVDRPARVPLRDRARQRDGDRGRADHHPAALPPAENAAGRPLPVLA